MASIVRTEDVLGGEPRIEGTRIGVRHVAGKVVDAGYTPAYVADQLDLSLGAVYEALSYYYDNIEEIRAIERDTDETRDRMEESSLHPKEPVS